MPRADVGVVGGRAGRADGGDRAADAGARVHVLATGHAATHWASGGDRRRRDCPGPRRHARRSDQLAADDGHPYRFLAAGAPSRRSRLVRSHPRRRGASTSWAASTIRCARCRRPIGATRPVAIVPDGMAAALARVGLRRDARRLRPGRLPRLLAGGDRGEPAVRRSWRGRDRRPRIEASASSCRTSPAGTTSPASTSPAPSTIRRGGIAALDAIARWPWIAGPAAPAGSPCRRSWGWTTTRPSSPRPAHACRWSRSRSPLVPPSIPGLRLYTALRAALRRQGGRLQIGEAVRGTVGARSAGSRTLVAPAAAREFVLSAGVGGPGDRWASPAVGSSPGTTGVLIETVLGLPVEAPPSEALAAQRPVRSGGSSARDGRHPDRRSPAAAGTRGRPLDPWPRTSGSAAACWPASATSASDAATAWRSRAGGWRAASSAVRRTRPPTARRGPAWRPARAADDDRRDRPGSEPPNSIGRSADDCLKCNVCNTVCPVARVTDLFPGPKYVGPQAQRFRLETIAAPGRCGRRFTPPTEPSTTARAAGCVPRPARPT